jgi:hypothetical protein
LEIEQSNYRDGADQVGQGTQAITLSSDQRKQYLGTYFSEELDAFYTLFEEGDSLVLQVGRYYTAELTASESDRFAWEFGTLEFQRDADDRIAGFLLHAGPIRNINFNRK